MKNYINTLTRNFTALSFDKTTHHHALKTNLVFLFSYTLYLLFSNRIPVSDSGQYFQNQFIFANSLISHAEIPLWSPHIFMGQHNIYDLPMVVSPFFALATLLAKALSLKNSLFVFYSSLFIDESILAFGCYLWCKKLYENPLTTLMVLSSLSLTTINLHQIWYSFKIYQFVPLWSYLFYYAIRDSDLSKFFQFCFVFSISLLNNLAYFLPLNLLILMIMILFVFREKLFQFSDLKLNKLTLSFLPLTIINLGIFYTVYKVFMNIFSFTTRNPNGFVGLETFLRYGHYTSPQKILELITGLNISRGVPIFSGFAIILFLPLLIKQFNHLNTKKYNLTRLFLIITLVFYGLSLGREIATALYYGIPFMKYYRHIGLSFLIAKPFFILALGQGIDIYLTNNNNQSEFNWPNFPMIFMMALFFLELQFNYADKSLLGELGQINNYAITMTSNIDTLNKRQIMAYLLVFAIIIGGKKILSTKNLAYLIIFLNVALLLKYKIERSKLSTIKLSSYERSQLLNFEKIKFNHQRIFNHHQNHKFNLFLNRHLEKKYSGHSYQEKSFENLKSDELLFQRNPTGHFSPLYSTINQVFSFDSCFLDYSSTVMNKNISWFWHYRASTLQRGCTRCARPHTKSDFHPNFFSQAGCHKPKLRIINYPSFLKNNEIQGKFRSEHKTKKSIKKDYLIGSPEVHLPPPNEKLNYKVMSFSPNELVFKIGQQKSNSFFLYYADAFHKDWKAQINGKETSVYKANGAFKSILAKPNSTVRLYITNDKMKLTYILLLIMQTIFFFYFLISMKKESIKKF